MSETLASSTSEEQKIDYKKTLNLPETAFSMKANAKEREPKIQAQWESTHLYQQLLDARSGYPRFLLHDGPPYLSSNKIHIGTALNKILKDIVVRYKWQTGHYTPFVPGYDGHGLPIENAILQNDKNKAGLGPVELRKACAEFAYENLKGQETHFKRLGILGNWAKPYVTIDGEFEAVQLQLFYQMYEKGYVYKGLKPVYWDPIFKTALAEAEVEYQDVISESIYVPFELNEASKAKLPDSIKNKKVSLVIWTTTPWTLPGNLGLCVNADFDYHFIDTPEWGVIGVASELLESVKAACNLGETKLLATVKGIELDRLVGIHPLYARDSLVVCGDHVTTEAGTGIVHTAPGHGVEDFIVGQRYGLDVICPVDESGKMLPEAGERLSGLPTNKATTEVIEWLKEKNALLAQAPLSHSYPHSWRSHKPIIYRATDQWFVSIDKIRQMAMDAIDTVQWLPERGKKRIASMVENRGDWCISRQRSWGVPIPIFYCEQCNTPHLTQEIINNVSSMVKKESSTVWWEKTAAELMGFTPACTECGHTGYKKEMDIMDVWFDSGVTHSAVVEARKEELGSLPVELYLEGSDQHRGWFQSSLLTSVMTNGKAPYKSVLTHGFVLDEQGRKMSKSLGNVVAPEKIIEQYGADVLRLWVASVDFTNDVKIGPNFLTQLAEVYKKVRNTIRFILGNLNGFNPSSDLQPSDKLSLLDKTILHRLGVMIENLTDSFEKYEFHAYYQALQNFCVTDLSSLYFDVAKDILYTAHPKSEERLAIQTVLYKLLESLLPLLVPVMPHLAEDIWHSLPDTQKPNFNHKIAPQSILLAPWPKAEFKLSDEESKAIELALKIRQQANLAIEPLRKEGQVGSNLEVELSVKLKTVDDKKLLTKYFSKRQLEQLVIVSDLSLSDELSTSEEVETITTISSHTKCNRCWKHLPSVSTFDDHPKLCGDCRDVVLQLG